MNSTLNIKHVANGTMTPVDHATVVVTRDLISEDEAQETHFSTIHHSLMPEANALQVATIIQLIRTRVDLCDYDTAENLDLQIDIEEDGFGWIAYVDRRDHIEFDLRFDPGTQTWSYEPKGMMAYTTPQPSFASLDEALGFRADSDPKVNASLMRRRRSPRRF